MTDPGPHTGYTPAPGTPLVTQTDRWQWQRRGARTLAAILDDHPDLPSISWLLGYMGGLVGEVIGLGVPPEQARATFTAWRHALGIKQVKETPIRDTGVVSLAGHTHHGVVRVGLVARVFYPFSDDEETPGTPTPGEAPRPGEHVHRAQGSRLSAPASRGTAPGTRPGRLPAVPPAQPRPAEGPRPTQSHEVAA
jgi:hypothetical protein